MFLKVKAGNFICFECGVLSSSNLELVNDSFFLNLAVIGQITIKKCSVKVNKKLEVYEFNYKIEFDRFVEDGVLNHFTLFFKEKKDKEFKRIKKYIKKGDKMAKSGNCAPNMPGTTGKPSGGGRGNCPSK